MDVQDDAVAQNALCGALATEFVSRIPRSSLAASMVFAFVAMIHAQKSDTNAPPNGASLFGNAAGVYPFLIRCRSAPRPARRI